MKYNEFTTNTITNKVAMLMDIILYLLQLIQYQHKQICWLLNFICRYIPLKQWAFDDSHSPKYPKFKIDELPLITDFRQDWTYKELIPYYEMRYGKKIRPISRRSECDIPDSCTCPHFKVHLSLFLWLCFFITYLTLPRCFALSSLFFDIFSFFMISSSNQFLSSDYFSFYGLH